MAGPCRCLTAVVLPVLRCCFRSHPDALTLGMHLPAKSQPAKADLRGTTVRPRSILFPRVVPSELFVWLGVAAWVKALCLPVTSLALRYIASPLLTGLIPVLIPPHLFVRRSLWVNAPP
ncbi:PTS glucitol/sorbitol transporter subunit IIC [Salmonella enterica]|uniref:PTS glucitol/sorbitol transporter subunit IIC n=1 Tax=Salmonella enterica TaxID=28901 RepID=UPI00398C421C